jgi:hypothetical protein
MLFLRLVGIPLGIPWMLLIVLGLAWLTFIGAALRIEMVQTVDGFLLVNNQTRVDFAYCQFLLRHPWILVWASIVAVTLRWCLARRGYAWPVQQIAMFPFYAALVIHTQAMSYLGGKFIQW